MTYHVEQKSGWSYVVGERGDLPARDSGPWRYQWEAQDYADELNARDAKFGGETTVDLADVYGYGPSSPGWKEPKRGDGEQPPPARLDKQEGQT